jgi:hypothetical protein
MKPLQTEEISSFSLKFIEMLRQNCTHVVIYTVITVEDKMRTGMYVIHGFTYLVH